MLRHAQRGSKVYWRDFPSLWVENQPLIKKSRDGYSPQRAAEKKCAEIAWNVGEMQKRWKTEESNLRPPPHEATPIPTTPRAACIQWHRRRTRPGAREEQSHSNFKDPLPLGFHDLAKKKDIFILCESAYSLSRHTPLVWHHAGLLAVDELVLYLTYVFLKVYNRNEIIQTRK